MQSASFRYGIRYVIWVNDYFHIEKYNQFCLIILSDWIPVLIKIVIALGLKIGYKDDSLQIFVYQYVIWWPFPSTRNRSKLVEKQSETLREMRRNSTTNCSDVYKMWQSVRWERRSFSIFLYNYFLRLIFLFLLFTLFI